MSKFTHSQSSQKISSQILKFLYRNIICIIPVLRFLSPKQYFFFFLFYFCWQSTLCAPISQHPCRLFSSQNPNSLQMHHLHERDVWTLCLRKQVCSRTLYQLTYSKPVVVFYTVGMLYAGWCITIRFSYAMPVEITIQLLYSIRVDVL